MEEKIEEFEDPVSGNEAFIISTVPFAVNSNPRPEATGRSLSHYFSNRISVFTILAFIFAAPFALVFFYYKLSFFLCVSMGACGISALWITLKRWEDKLKDSVAALVAAKVEKISFQEEKSHLSHLAEVDKLKEEALNYSNTIENLKNLLRESRRGYEHQIDLLQTSIAKSKAQIAELSFQMESKFGNIHQIQLESEDLKRECQRLNEELGKAIKEGEARVEHKDSLLSEYQHTISEQRMILEKKQRYILKLESKIKDLMYEIRSLLQLEEAPPPTLAMHLTEPSEPEPQIYKQEESGKEPPPFDVASKLQKCLEIAQNITGVNHLGFLGGRSPRFLDISLDSYALDLRRLGDHWRDEGGGIIFLYSPIEKRMLFCSNRVKNLLGITPEKFIKDFPYIIHAGSADFEEALLHLKETPKDIKLMLRTKDAALQFFDCLLGTIPGGPFAGFIVGILSPVE